MSDMVEAKIARQITIHSKGQVDLITPEGGQRLPGWIVQITSGNDDQLEHDLYVMSEEDLFKTFHPEFLSELREYNDPNNSN